MVGTWFAHGTAHATVQHDSAEFAAPDASLARALASAVGVALEQHERLDEQRRRQDWQLAGTTITTLLLSGADPRSVRSAVTEHATLLDRAAGAAIIVPTEKPDQVRVVAGSGLLDPGSAGEILTADDALARLAATRNAATATLHPAPHPTPGTVGPGPAMAAALGADAGVLLVVRGGAGQPFRAAEVDMIASFAAHAGLALALAEARRKRDLLRLVEDRERIAAQLSEQAMRELLDISTTVHGLTARMQSPDDAQRLIEQGDRLDGVLREMQRAIFGLQAPARAWQGSAAR